MSSLRLLLVEDDPNDASLVELSLEAANIEFSLDTVATSAECEQMLLSRIYDAMLSDYRLPSFNGLEALKIWKKLETEIPFILVTGSLGEEAAVECIKAGMTDYVLKERLFRLPMVLKRALNEFELRRQKKDAIIQIQQQAWQLKIINQTLQAMRESMLLQDVLKTTAYNLQQSLQVSFCLIIQDHEKEDLHQYEHFSNGLDADKFLGPAFDLANSFQDQLSHGHQIVCDDIGTLPSSMQAALHPFELFGFMVAPLLYQQKYLGAIALYHCGSKRHWLETEKDLLKAIADQCAIALHQAELYENLQTELRERKKIETKLRYDSLHDSLTDLPNRSLILDRLNHALERYKRQTQDRKTPIQNFAILFLDLDHFKLVNDSLGHSVGDQLLIKVSEILKTSLRESDSLGRLGGDEFVILLEDINNLSDVFDVVNRIQKSFEEPISLEEHSIAISTSIGIVISSINYQYAEDLIRDADTAMYRAKNIRRGSYTVFNPEMHSQALSQLKTKGQLREAIYSDELQVLFQPIMSLSETRLLGFEALVRWQHPQWGLISPQEFIPVAEDSGLIIPLDLWVLENSCHQLRRWRERYDRFDSIFLSVNLSGQNFSQIDLVAKVDEILERVQVPPHCLTLEITENTLIEKTQVAVDILRQLQARNISISLDDFGTGYTSLSYLRRFPINTIKLDRSFVTHFSEDIRNEEIIRSITGLGHKLGLKLVAEGIENENQLDFLSDIGCHAGQGYLFSAPLNSVQADKWLSNIF